MQTPKVTISAGAALSTALALGGNVLRGIDMPTAASGWTAASLTFQVSSGSGGPWKNVFVGGVEYSVAAGVDRFIILSPSWLGGWGYVRLRSGVAATPVNQAATRTLGLLIITAEEQAQYTQAVAV